MNSTIALIGVTFSRHMFKRNLFHSGGPRMVNNQSSPPTGLVGGYVCLYT